MRLLLESEADMCTNRAVRLFPIRNKVMENIEESAVCGLTREECERYDRNIRVPEIGVEGQCRLKGSSVLVIGCGALGSVCGMYLAGAGIGRIGIMDYDVVSESNLQRQVFYRESEVGEPKVAMLANRMHSLNADVVVEMLSGRMNEENVSGLIAAYDFILDCTDSGRCKYMVSEACREAGKACCIGGVRGFEGQVMTYTQGHAAYSDIFPVIDVAEDDKVNGVVGATPGMIASVMTAEALKYLMGIGSLLTDRIFMMNLLGNDAKIFSLR